MNIRYVYTNRLGRQEERPGHQVVPEVGSVISFYPSNPGRGNPVEPDLVLEVTGPANVEHIRTTFGQAVNVLVPCKLVK